MPVRLIRRYWSLFIFAHLQNRHKGFLRNFHGADLFHAFFAGVLFFQQLALTGDLAPITFRAHLFSQGFNIRRHLDIGSNGRLYRHQLRHCEAVFAAVPEDMTRIVVAHHHFAPGHDKVFDVAMPQSRRAIDCFVEQKVEMILGGHLHRSYIGNSLDFFPGHDRERGVIIVQCGTTTSSRGKGLEREENTFNLIEVGTDTLAVTHYLYFEAAGKFAPISKHVFPRHGRVFDTGSGASPP